MIIYNLMAIISHLMYTFVVAIIRLNIIIVLKY
jgi:hypothetical protein